MSTLRSTIYRESIHRILYICTTVKWFASRINEIHFFYIFLIFKELKRGNTRILNCCESTGRLMNLYNVHILV